MNAMDAVIKARSALLRDQPFFGSLALRLLLKVDEACATAWTNGADLGFSSAFVLGLSFAEVLFVVAHEILHCAMGHISRRGNRDAKIWNMACDYAINSSLIKSGFTAPRGALVNPGFEGLSPEAIYAVLTKDQPEGKSKDSGSGQGGQGGPGDQGKQGDPGGCGEVRDAAAKDGGPASESDLRESETDWKVAVSQAVNVARGDGSLGSAEMDRLIAAALAPVLDWKTILHRFVQEQVQKTQTWAPPDRRYVWQGVYSPGLGGTEAGHVVVGVDTSGSIYASPEAVEQFAAEIQAVRDETGAELTVIYCDAAVQRVDHFDKEEEISIKPVGGGGTDFGPVFERVEADGLRPACLIYLTDLEGSFPAAEPEYPVLWAVLGNGAAAPFGEVLRIR